MVSLQLRDGPFAAGVGLLWELAPRHQGVTAGGDLPSAAQGFVLGGPCAGWAAGDNGGCGWAGGWHSGLAVKQNKSTGTFLYLRLSK